MLKTILLVLLLLIAVVLVVAAMRPNSFRVERTATINAPAEKIFPYINDFREWSAWSPYEKRDPAMQRKLSGAASGAGSVYEWDGNKDIGQGRMEMLEATPPSKVLIKLDFMRPFEAHNTAELTLKPNGDATDVTWAMSGPSPYIAKLMGLFFSMDKMIGKDFEAGLDDLKALAEG
ncbi:MAG: SRPBCC family protein [Phyllobacterium sp.]